MRAELDNYAQFAALIQDYVEVNEALCTARLGPPAARRSKPEPATTGQKGGSEPASAPAGPRRSAERAGRPRLRTGGRGGPSPGPRPRRAPHPQPRRTARSTVGTGCWKRSSAPPSTPRRRSGWLPCPEWWNRPRRGPGPYSLPRRLAYCAPGGPPHQDRPDPAGRHRDGPRLLPLPDLQARVRAPGRPTGCGRHQPLTRPGTRVCAGRGRPAYDTSRRFIATVTGLDLASTSTLARTTRAHGARARDLIAAEHAAAIGPFPVPAVSAEGPQICYVVLHATGAPMLPSECTGRAGKGPDQERRTRRDPGSEDRLLVHPDRHRSRYRRPDPGPRLGQ